MRIIVFAARYKALSLMLVALSFLHGVSAYSQSTMSAGSSCLSVLAWGTDYGIPPYGPCETSVVTGNYAYDCYYWNYQCQTGPGCSRNRAPASCGNPISLANGNTYIEQKDLALPGLGGGLRLIRTWNSLWPNKLAFYGSQMFGGNWKSNFEERVFSASSGYMTYARGDGSFWSFQPSGTQWQLVSPANETVFLTLDGSYWTIKFQNGESRLFSYVGGSLSAIVDRNGNATTLKYDLLNRLTTVTDPASRHIYFSYESNSSTLVAAVTSDVGLSLSYTYDTSNRLVQVTNPDNSTLEFEYDASNSYWITAVKDSQGKILESHTYDGQGRGLTSARANGVDALTLDFSN
jgi:YD repeat-containing protein